MNKIFSYSEKEIRRRKFAYLMLSDSIVIGLVLWPIIFSLQLPAFILITIPGILVVGGILVFRSFRSQLQGNIRIIDGYLERSPAEKYLLQDLLRLNTKRTIKGTIRELDIRFQNGKSLYVNGLQDFEQFNELLKQSSTKTAVFTETHEPLDFDHPLFYPVLGQILSFFIIVVFKLLAATQFQTMKLVLIGIAIYLMVLGAFFLYAKPISKRYGVNTTSSDLLIGIIMICSGVTILGVNLFASGRL